MSKLTIDEQMVQNSFLHKSFFQGRNFPKDIHPESQDAIDWWNLMLDYSFNGYSYKNTRITGDMFWYINFFPIIRMVDPNNTKLGTVFAMPWASQDDDYLSKQIEEAEQDGKHVMFFTGRGYGKTYFVISIGAKNYMCVPNSHNIFSASSENHIKETYNNKLLLCIDEMNKRYSGSLSKNTGKRDETDLISGIETTNDKGEKVFTGFQSRCERIIYGTKEGATKGRRPDFQLFEEVGDWSGAAKLKACYAASEGSWYRGSLLTCRVFFIGTGGQMSSGGSRDAKDMFYHPEAFNLYTVKDWKKPTAIFIMASHKFGGYWEQTGVSLVEEARAIIEQRREEKKSDPIIYYRYLQEYPLTPEECFLVQGSNIFPQQIVAGQLAKLLNEKDPEIPQPEKFHIPMGKLVAGLHKMEWVYESNKSNRIVGVKAVPHPDGKVCIVEHPEHDGNMNMYRNLYIAGYDGIDIGKDDSESGVGSRGALMIKKRMISAQRTNNMYVCKYSDRPNDIEENYETVLQLLWYYGAQVNIEFSRVRIVQYFRERNEGWRFMKRPAIVNGDPLDFSVNKIETKLVGTIMNERMKDYGQQAIAKYMKQFGNTFWFNSTLEQMRDYTPDEQGKFDEVVAMMLCEIADDEMIQVSVQAANSEPVIQAWGWYTDPITKRKQYGVLPDKNTHKEVLFGQVNPFRLYGGVEILNSDPSLFPTPNFEPPRLLENIYTNS